MIEDGNLPELPSTSVAWKSGATLPIPDWEAITAEDAKTDAELHAFWNGIARLWLVALANGSAANTRLLNRRSFCCSVRYPKDNSVWCWTTPSARVSEY